MSRADGAGVVRFIRGAASVPEASDADLVRSFAADADEQAFRVLLARHGPVVWAVCRRMLHNHHDAEDAFQATFLVLARGAAGIRSGSAVAGWLCGVAARVSSRVRSAKRTETADVEPAAGHPDGALGDLTVREAEALLYDELARLPEKYRTALVLCCLEGLSNDAAATQLGWSANQLKNALEQGRERLRSRLARRGIALGVPLLAGLLSPATASAVPPALSDAAVSLGTGIIPPAAVSNLAHGVTRTLWIAKWKWAAAACAALVLTGGGLVAGLLQQPESPPPAAKPAPVALVPAPPPVVKGEGEVKLPNDPVLIATAYLQHIIDGKPELAIKLADPKKITDRKIKEMQTAGLKRVKIAMLLLNTGQVHVITERQPLVRRPGAEAEDAHAVVTLARDRRDAPWIVRDNDIADVGAVWREVDDYLKGEFNLLQGAKAEVLKKPEPPKAAWDVATQFLKLVHAEKTQDAQKLTVPGTISENKLGELQKAGIGASNPVVVLINDTRMEVAYDGPYEEKGESRHVVIMLTKAKDGAWQVKDIDGRDEKKLEERVRIYLAGAYDERMP